MSGTATLVGRILANDLRLYFRAWQRGRTRRWRMVLIQLLFLGFLHVAVYPVVLRFGGTERLPGVMEFACVFIGLLIAMVALQRSLEVLYSRGDLPMFLASPVPRRVIVWTRLADIQATTWFGSALVLFPLLNVATWLFGPTQLVAWLAWLFGSLAIVPSALLLTVFAVRAFGPRRARLGIQIASILFGIGAVAAAQAPNWMGAADSAAGAFDAQRRFFGWFAQPGLAQLAAAARGDPAWLGVLALAGTVLGVCAFRVLVQAFSRGAQDLAATSDGSQKNRVSASEARAWSRAFHGSRMRALLRKELRLVSRDPLLLIRASTQIVSLVPALAIVLWHHTAAGVAAFGLVGPPVIAITLATMMTFNDEALAFVASSPISPRRAACARTAAAAALPILVAVGLAIATWFLGEPTVALICVALGSLTSVALACTVRPRSEDDRAKNRQPKAMSQYFYATFIGALGAGGVSALVHDQLIVALVLLLFATGGAAYAFTLRPRPWSETPG
jgi:ABC-2 type transport system permease protein